jgi:hypothetical protein
VATGDQGNCVVELCATVDAARGDRLEPRLLAHVLVSKFADRQPLYRRSEIYAREGVDLDRSTLAGWVDATNGLLAPLVKTVRDHVMSASKLHVDDTPVPVLAPGNGRAKTGRLWTYVRHDRPSAEVRKTVRQARAKPLLDGVRLWLEATLANSHPSPMRLRPSATPSRAGPPSPFMLTTGSWRWTTTPPNKRRASSRSDAKTSSSPDQTKADNAPQPSIRCSVLPTQRTRPGDLAPTHHS